MTRPRKPGAIGLSYRAELNDLVGEWRDAGLLDCCEVHADAFRDQTITQSAVSGFSRLGIPVYLHSTTLDFATADRASYFRSIEEIASLPGLTEVELVSAHLASGKQSVGQIQGFARPAYTGALCELVVERMAEAEAMIGRPVVIENIAYYGDALDDQFTEIDFFNRLAVLRPNRILFDISNFLTNQTNGSTHCGDIADLALEHAQYVHISGGRRHNSIYVDTHGDPIPESHFGALKELIAKCPGLRIIYERDMRCGNRPEIDRDLWRISELAGAPAFSG